MGKTILVSRDLNIGRFADLEIVTIRPKATKVGSIIGQRIDYNGLATHTQ